MKRIGCATLGIVLSVVFAFACPTDIGLSEQGIRCLAILLLAVAWWVGSVLPAYATAIIMVVLFAVIGGVESSIALSAFTSDTWWLLLAAFGLGAGMKGSGLLRRIALAVVRTFPNTFAAQAASLMVAGTIVGPLVPSMAAKVSMLTPLAMGIGDALGYERFSKPMQGLFLAMFCGVRSVAPAVLNASVIGYCLLGLFPSDVQARFDVLHWFLAALPWFIMVTVLTYASIVVLYQPRGEGVAKAARDPVQKSEVLGPMSRREKQMCAIILATVVLWVAGPAFETLAGNPYLFVLGEAVITLAMRFLIVSEMAYLNIVMVFLVPLCASVGFNPWVAGFAMYAVITPWFVLYQSATYLAAFYSVDGQMAHHADLAKYCVVYTIICMLALVASVPYWQWMGLL